MGSDLAAKQCIPCRGGVPPLAHDEIQELLVQLGRDWTVVDDHHLHKEYRLEDFAGALALTNRIAAIAEEQNHHPDIYLAWGKVAITIWTHKIDGLTESDFVFAAKCEEVA
jgi:4a-hydroxytetrahydrobiopterin dehydratase